MGFIKRTQRRRFEFKHFGLSHSIDRPELGYEPRQVHNPSTNQDVTKYVQRFDAIDGMVIDAEWYDRKDNSGHRYVGYKLVVDAGEEIIDLDFPYGKPAYRVLTRHGRNVDWSKIIKFSAWLTKTPEGKDATAVCFWQTGADGKEATVKSAHTKENPNGCPEPEQSMKGLNFDKAERWLRDQFDKICVPKIKTTGAKHQPSQPAAKAAIATATAGYGDPNDPNGDFGPTNDYPPDEDDQVPF